MGQKRKRKPKSEPPWWYDPVLHARRPTPNGTVYFLSFAELHRRLEAAEDRIERADVLLSALGLDCWGDLMLMLFHEEYGGPPLRDPAACEWPMGTDEKVSRLAEREARAQELWRPGDRDLVREDRTAREARPTGSRNRDATAVDGVAAPCRLVTAGVDSGPPGG